MHIVYGLYGVALLFGLLHELYLVRGYPYLSDTNKVIISFSAALFATGKHCQMQSYS
jgi:hypothetical protein